MNRERNPSNRMSPIKSDGDITVELSSRSAYRLWNGRERTEEQHGILGVPGFARLIKSLEQAIAQDDPYADYTYMIIENAIEELSESLDADIGKMDALIASKIPSTMKFSAMASVKPIVVPLKFGSRLGFGLVYSLIKADQVALKILQASHLNVLSKKEKFTFLADNERKFRAVMNKVFAFRTTGVTRDDIVSNNEKAIEAQELMGRLEAGYLSGELRSCNAPRLPGWSRAMRGEIRTGSVG